MDPERTYHLVPEAVWRQLAPGAPYAPPSLKEDGFIHCTDGAKELAATANRYYRDVPVTMLALVIERARIIPHVRYDDRKRIYPHIYGPLNRDAIVAVLRMPRTPDGTYLPPEPEHV